MKHDTPHRWAGKEVRIKPTSPLANADGDLYVLEDWWDRVYGSSWMYADGNPAALAYAMRTATSGGRIPFDDEVVYGKVGAFGHLLHKTELHSLVGEEWEQ